MLELIKELREFGATEISFDEAGRVTNVKFGSELIRPPATPEAERVARITMQKPEDARLNWYRAVAGVTE